MTPETYEVLVLEKPLFCSCGVSLRNMIRDMHVATPSRIVEVDPVGNVHEGPMSCRQPLTIFPVPPG